MLKRGFAFALALVMLVSVASAVEAVTPDGDTYEVSAWAQKDVAEAWNVGFIIGGYLILLGIDCVVMACSDMDAGWM